MEENAEEYSSVGENEGIKDLGSLGVDVKDLDGLYVGDGNVLLLEGKVGDRGGRGGI